MLGHRLKHAIGSRDVGWAEFTHLGRHRVALLSRETTTRLQRRQLDRQLQPSDLSEGQGSSRRLDI